MVRSLSFSSIPSFPYGRPVAACVFFLVFPSFLSSIFLLVTFFRRQFLRKLWPIQLAFFLLIVCRIFVSSSTLFNISSCPTWSVQLIFSIRLPYHISKFSRYFWFLPNFQHDTKLYSNCSAVSDIRITKGREKKWAEICRPDFWESTSFRKQVGSARFV